VEAFLRLSRRCVKVQFRTRSFGCFAGREQKLEERDWGSRSVRGVGIQMQKDGGAAKKELSEGGKRENEIKPHDAFGI